MADYEVAVIGGGMIGAAIAFGAAKLGCKTALFDEGDVAFRAARGNFGLIWVQGKGDGCLDYADWTRRSADLWQTFNEELRDLTGIETGYERRGGLHLCLSEEELNARDAKLSKMRDASSGAFQYEMLDHKAVANQMPGLGPRVAGGSFSPQDGHVNPLFLLRALHAALGVKGGELHFDAVNQLNWRNGQVEVVTKTRRHSAEKLVLAAGLGSRSLAASVGLAVPVAPQRGQIIVTEKVAHFLKLPTNFVRQTLDGGVLLGDSQEEAGFDDGTEPRVLRGIAARACRLFPVLGSVRIVRAWGALRILTPDGFPVYDQSSCCPGVFSASAHSGVTLAAAHALDFAGFVVEGRLPPSLAALSERRFYVH